MGRKFKNMQTEEQRYAARATSQPHPARPTTPASHEVWTSMSAYEQAAHLCRLDGKEEEAREWERMEMGTQAAPKRRRWPF